MITAWTTTKNHTRRDRQVIMRAMKDDLTMVFHGFLNLPNLDKLKLVEIMNDYFDNLDRREAIRAENAQAFKTASDKPDFSCICCRDRSI